MPDTYADYPGGAAPHTHSHDTELTDVSPDDHHAEVHTIGGAAHTGQLSHDTDLTGVSPDDHHAEVHTIGGAAHTGQLSHDTDLTGVSPDDHHAQVHSIIGADHSGFPGGTATFLRADATFAAPPGGGGGLSLTTVEIALGVTPRRSGRFTIAGAGMTPGDQVLVVKAVGPYTGKGSRSDEAEMDAVTASGIVLDAATIEVFWQADGPVKGNVKFDYAIG